MSDSQQPAIARTTHLSQRWDDRPLFTDLNVVVPAGITLVQGDEQTGKSTLLRLLAGEITPNSGWVEIQGIRADHDATAYAQRVFRTDPLHASLDQVSAAQWFPTLPTRYPLFNLGVLTDLVGGFDLLAHVEKPMYMLSAGSRRKVGLCAAFASGAELTLIDQPFAALDGPSTRLLREVLQDVAEATHRACVIADYQGPESVPLAATIGL